MLPFCYVSQHQQPVGTSGRSPGATLSLDYLHAPDMGSFLSSSDHANPRVVKLREPQLPRLEKAG